MFHYRATKQRYSGYPKPVACPFCDHKILDGPTVETTHAIVVPNRVFYDIWEVRTVTDHLLIIPKRHVRSLSELTRSERLDIMAIMADYESRGYNVYARAVDSKQRSIEHQHTHLIKTAARPGRFSLYLKKPYLLLKF